MFNIDPFMKTGLIAFFIPTALGCLSYMVATLLARLFSSTPHGFYMSRIVFVIISIILVCIYCNPNFVMMGGPSDANLLYQVKIDGRGYGSITTFSWLIIAFLRRPKAGNENTAA